MGEGEGEREGERERVREREGEGEREREEGSGKVRGTRYVRRAVIDELTTVIDELNTHEVSRKVLQI